MEKNKEETGGKGQGVKPPTQTGGFDALIWEEDQNGKQGQNNKKQRASGTRAEKAEGRSKGDTSHGRGVGAPYNCCKHRDNTTGRN